MSTQEFVADAVGHAVVAVVCGRIVALCPERVTCIAPVVAATVLLAGVPGFKVKRSAVAAVPPPASRTVPVPTTVAVNSRRPPVASLLAPPLLTGLVGSALSHRSQVVSPVVFAQLSPPAISTCVELTSAAAALHRTVANVPPENAQDGLAPRSQSSNSLKLAPVEAPPA